MPPAAAPAEENVVAGSHHLLEPCVALDRSVDVIRVAELVAGHELDQLKQHRRDQLHLNCLQGLGGSPAPPL